MKLPQLIFRITFLVLAIVYLTVLTDFLDPKIFDVNIDIRYDVVGLTLLVIGYVAFFMKKS